MLQIEYGYDNFFRSIEWNSKNEDPEVIRKMVSLAQLTARIRSTVTVWNTEGGDDNKDVDFTIPIIEGPKRLSSILYGLARGHAIISGRDSVCEEDMPLLVAVALSSMPDDRRRVLDLMTNPDEPEKTSDIGMVKSSEVDLLLGVSRPKARKVLEILSILKVGDKSGGGMGHESLTLTLKPCYKWLCSNDFIEYKKSWLHQEAAEKSQEIIPF